MSMSVQEKELCDKRAFELNSDDNYQIIIGDIKSTVASIRVTQDDRIRESNRNHEKADGSKTKNAKEAAKVMKTSQGHKEFVAKMVSGLRDFEEEWVEHLKDSLKPHPVYSRWLKNVPGIGPALAGDLLAEFKIQNIYYIGQMFSYAGIVGSTARKKGEKATYNVYLKKRLLGVMPGNFLKAHSPYSVIYYEYRIKMMQRWMNSSTDEREKLSLGHQHLMANRKMIQAFIKDYYVAFRQIMNIPVIKSYEEEKLGMIHAGNSWVTPATFMDMSKEGKNALKERTVKRINELKAELEHLIELSGIPRQSKDAAPTDTAEE